MIKYLQVMKHKWRTIRRTIDSEQLQNHAIEKQKNRIINGMALFVLQTEEQ